jgi:hypothetical protein
VGDAHVAGMALKAILSERSAKDTSPWTENILDREQASNRAL